MATWPGILGALAAGVTCCKTRHLLNLFLKRKALGKWQLGWLADLDVNSGAHGVTRPTAQELACGREVSAVVDSCFKA